MKKHHYITLAIVLVGLAVSASFFLFPRQLSPEECSAEFLRYKDVEGIDASFVKDFPVNDTLAVDVTTLQATDSAGWETLKKDFHIAELSPQAIEMLKHTESTVGVRLTPKNDIGASCDTANLDNNYILTIDNLEHTVGIFYTKNKQEIEQIRLYYFNNLKKRIHEKNN